MKGDVIMRIFLPLICAYCGIVNLCGGMEQQAKQYDNILIRCDLIVAGDTSYIRNGCSNVASLFDFSSDSTILDVQECIRNKHLISPYSEIACFFSNGKLSVGSTLRQNNITCGDKIIVLVCPQAVHISLDMILAEINPDLRNSDLAQAIIHAIEVVIEVNNKKYDDKFFFTLGRKKPIMKINPAILEEECNLFNRSIPYSAQQTVVPPPANGPSCAPLPRLMFY
jgi:hypothetical protein